MQESSIQRLVLAAALLLGVIGLGTVGYNYLGGGTWTLGETLYFALITVSTVGYGEMHDVGNVPGARALTGVLILLGSGALVYFQSNITATLVEGRLGKAFRRKRMQREIHALKEHFVIAGIGATGRHVIEELVAVEKAFVAVDTDLQRLERLSNELMGGKMLFVHADATQDSTLIEAGVERAAGVVSALSTDHENLYVTLSARSLNPVARIVTKVNESEAKRKMLIAGANVTVSPTIIGGLRMASEILRPDVVQFLDQMMTEKDRRLRFEEITVQDGSPFRGQTLRRVPLREVANVLVIAARDAQQGFVYNPGPDFRLEVGSVLIVIAKPSDVARARDLLRGQKPSS
jgi:voltage-gated potassium channel